jgi:hypothetical protein
MTDGRDPIPASYYKGSKQAAPTAAPPPKAPGSRPWYRRIPGFRSGNVPKAVIAVIGYLIIAAWIVQFPINPALGVLGVLSLGVVALIFDVGQIRTRLPIFRSSNRVLAAAGWGAIAIAMLVAAAFATPSSAPSRGSNSTAALTNASPSPQESAASPAVSPTTKLTPSPSPSPRPSPSPTPSPSSVEQPPAPTPITFLNAPLRAAPGQTVTLNVRTGPSVYCTIEVDYKSGPSNAQGLSPKTSSTTGAVSWTWTVGARTTAGTWPITVSCGNNSASTTITVT